MVYYFIVYEYNTLYLYICMKEYKREEGGFRLSGMDSPVVVRKKLTMSTA